MRRQTKKEKNSRLETASGPKKQSDCKKKGRTRSRWENRQWQWWDSAKWHEPHQEQWHSPDWWKEQWLQTLSSHVDYFLTDFVYTHPRMSCTRPGVKTEHLTGRTTHAFFRVLAHVTVAQDFLPTRSHFGSSS